MRLSKFKNHSLVGIAVIAQLMLLDVSAAGTKIAFADSDICQLDRIDIPQALKDAPTGDPNGQPILIEADEVESEPNARVQLSGNARLTQGKHGIYADQITYDQQTAQATATRNVRFYTLKGDEVLADSLQLNMDSETGVAHNVRAQFVDDSPPQTSRAHDHYIEDYSLLAPFRKQPLPTTKQATTDAPRYVRFRATADRIELESAERERLYNATFSSCPQGNEDVLLQAKEIELDHTTGVGIAKSIVVKFKRIPLLYLPIASFPIGNKRKTGFLIPQVRSQGSSGIIISAPYYINIAPNHDATVIPKVLTKRGAQLYGEYRYLTQQSGQQPVAYQSRGIIKAEVLPSDSVFKRDRHAFIYQHKQSFNDNWSGEIDFQTLSDRRYLADFSSGFGASSLSHVPQRADLLYHSPKLFFKVSLSAYETANRNVSTADRPYSRLPEINLNLKPREIGLFSYGIESDFTQFKLPNNRVSGRVTGTRLRIKPHVSLPIHRSFGYVIPKISLQTINYTLDDSNSPSTNVPIISVDSGLIFERGFEKNDTRFIQTLEPRLFYVKIPPKLEQETRPNFDSGIRGNNSFGHLFRENRFFSGDRVGDTHQVTLGLTSRITDSVGRQRLKMSLGQIFFLDRREVGLSNTTPPETQSQSSFIAEITAAVTKDWSLRSFTRMDKANTLDFARISVDYAHSSRRNAMIGYSRDQDSSEQINLAFQLPIAPRWQIDGKSKYSTQQSEIREFALGINYDSCCWAVKLLAERDLVGMDKFQNRFTIALELGLLGRVRL